MKEIILTNGMRAQVSDKDYARVNCFTWYPLRRRPYDAIYAVKGRGKTHSLMHRFILGLEKNDGIIVDHKDRNGLNNMRSNIRIATFSQNLQNSKGKNSKCGFKGVTTLMRGGRVCYQARITRGGKQTYLGLFETAEIAASAYDVASKKLFGKFARTNGLEENFDPAIRADSIKNRGLYYRTDMQKWIANIWLSDIKKTVHLGTFCTKEEAFIAREKAKLKRK